MNTTYDNGYLIIEADSVSLKIDIRDKTIQEINDCIQEVLIQIQESKELVHI